MSDPNEDLRAAVSALRSELDSVKQELRKLQQVIMAVTQFAVVVEMQFKHHLACRRPIEWSAQVQPMITTPGHGTFPMGHAAQIYAVAVVLKDLFAEALGGVLPPSLNTQINRLAYRVSENRIVAGVHFPADLTSGAVLGAVLGRLALDLFRQQRISRLDNPIFAASSWEEGAPLDVAKVAVGDLPGRPYGTETLSGCPSPMLAALWTGARDELKQAMGR